MNHFAQLVTYASHCRIFIRLTHTHIHSSGPLQFAFARCCCTHSFFHGISIKITNCNQLHWFNANSMFTRYSIHMSTAELISFWILTILVEVRIIEIIQQNRYMNRVFFADHLLFYYNVFQIMVLYVAYESFHVDAIINTNRIEHILPQLKLSFIASFTFFLVRQLQIQADFFSLYFVCLTFANSF